MPRKLGVLLPLFSVVLLLAAFLALGSPVASAAPLSVQIKPIGSPSWRPVDFHVFTAPVGTAENGYAEFGQTMEALLPAPNHEWHNDLGPGRGPGIPHAPPYNREMADGVAALVAANPGLVREHVRFKTSEFSNGRGVWAIWMNVPAPGTRGSSPDFAVGPIIPNHLFPIHVSGTTYRNGRVWNPFLGTGDVPPLDGSINPPFDVDGHSHFPIFYADVADFGPPGGMLRGSYRFEVTMEDTSGSGWHISVHFTIAP